jgi:hypothetical protein
VKLCVDGYPRSANSLLCQKLILANRRFVMAKDAMFHHTHTTP